MLCLDIFNSTYFLLLNYGFRFCVFEVSVYTNAHMYFLGFFMDTIFLFVYLYCPLLVLFGPVCFLIIERKSMALG